MRLSERSAVRVGYVLSSVVILFMLFDGGIKLVPPAMVIETTAQLGYPATVSFVRGLGILGLSCTLLYAIPRTSALGAILLTGYLGGTVAIHLRVGSPVFSHMLFGVYLGILLWGGLDLRDGRLRSLVPYGRHGA
jgi:DoxX-like family